MQKVVVCGRGPTVTALLETLVDANVPLMVTSFAPQGRLEEFDGITALSQISTNDFQVITAKGFADADAIVFGNFAETDGLEALQTNLDAVRQIINTAMTVGFQGKVIVAMPDDAVITYFAQQFSGLDQQHILGLGTMAATWCLSRFIATALNVPLASVTAYVFGAAARPIPIWTRAYVGATPVLSLISQQQEILVAGEQAVATFAQHISPLVVARQVVALLSAFAGHPQIAPVSHFVADASETLKVVAAPALIDAEGARTVAAVSGSEAEAAAVAAVNTMIETQIQQVIDDAERKNEA